MAGSLRLRAKFGHFAPPSLSLSPFELLATFPDNPQTQLEKFHFTHLNGQLGPWEANGSPGAIDPSCKLCVFRGKGFDFQFQYLDSQF